MLVSINPERLLVQIDRNLGQNAEALIQVVSESLEIHDGLQVGVSRRMTEGIAIVDRPDLDRGRRGAADLQGLRLIDRRWSRCCLLELPDAAPPRLLGICRGLLDLRLRLQARRASRPINSMMDANRAGLCTATTGACLGNRPISLPALHLGVSECHFGGWAWAC